MATKTLPTTLPGSDIYNSVIFTFGLVYLHKFKMEFIIAENYNIDLLKVNDTPIIRLTGGVLERKCVRDQITTH